MVLPPRRSAVRRVSSAASKPGADDADDAGDSLEAALAQLGPFGFYQGYMLIMLCIPNLLACMYSLNYIFVADSVPFRCVVPECEGGAPQFDNEAASALLPATACQRYAPLPELGLGGCERDAFHQNRTIACDAFVYENMDTIFAEFNLGCREWMRTMVGTVRNIALPFALVLTGYVSDTYGRRTAFCLFAAFAGVMGIVKAFSVNYQMYLAMEFLEAALGYGFNSAGYVMMIEIAHPSLRATFACATGIAYGVGGVLFAWLAWGVPYWRHLLVTIHSLALLLPLYWLLLPESPRWLHARGDADKTTDVIRKAARWNKIIVNEQLMSKLKDDTKAEAEAAVAGGGGRLAGRAPLARAAGAPGGVRLVLGRHHLRVLRPHHQLGGAVRQQARQLRAQHVHGDRCLRAHHDGAGAHRPQALHLHRLPPLRGSLRFSLLRRSRRHVARPVLCGQAGHHVRVQLTVCVHGGAVPHARALVGAGRLLAHRPPRLHLGAADAAAEHVRASTAVRRVQRHGGAGRAVHAGDARRPPAAARGGRRAPAQRRARAASARPAAASAPHHLCARHLTSAAHLSPLRAAVPGIRSATASYSTHGYCRIMTSDCHRDSSARARRRYT